jgi:hypothetical protein
MLNPDTVASVRRRWRSLLLVVFMMAVLLVLWTRKMQQPVDRGEPNNAAAPVSAMGTAKLRERMESHFSDQAPTLEQSPEQIVARKLSQFARSRRDFARELARRHNVQVSTDVEQFFAAVESGNWDE